LAAASPTDETAKSLASLDAVIAALETGDREAPHVEVRRRIAAVSAYDVERTATGVGDVRSGDGGRRPPAPDLGGAHRGLVSASPECTHLVGRGPRGIGKGRRRRRVCALSNDADRSAATDRLGADRDESCDETVGVLRPSLGVQLDGGRGSSEPRDSCAPRRRLDRDEGRDRHRVRADSGGYVPPGRAERRSRCAELRSRSTAERSPRVGHAGSILHGAARTDERAVVSDHGRG
jgi:hypothetical protein